MYRGRLQSLNDFIEMPLPGFPGLLGRLMRSDIDMNHDMQNLGDVIDHDDFPIQTHVQIG